VNVTGALLDTMDDALRIVSHFTGSHHKPAGAPPTPQQAGQAQHPLWRLHSVPSSALPAPMPKNHAFKTLQHSCSNPAALFLSFIASI
jgi:hypothetical protein